MQYSIEYIEMGAFFLVQFAFYAVILGHFEATLHALKIVRGCVSMGTRGAMAPTIFQRVAYGTHEFFMSTYALHLFYSISNSL